MGDEQANELDAKELMRAYAQLEDAERQYSSYVESAELVIRELTHGHALFSYALMASMEVQSLMAFDFQIRGKVFHATYVGGVVLITDPEGHTVNPMAYTPPSDEAVEKGDEL